MREINPHYLKMQHVDFIRCSFRLAYVLTYDVSSKCTETGVVFIKTEMNNG